jgi:pimeloyl-ACP methyl ester carboxylesterase
MRRTAPYSAARVIGSYDVRLKAAREAHQRSYRPDGVTRQMAAVIADGSRVERLRELDVPTLVIHGADDPLIPVAAGRDRGGHTGACDSKSGISHSRRARTELSRSSPFTSHNH